MFNKTALRTIVATAFLAAPGAVLAEGATSLLARFQQIGFVEDTGAAIRIEAGDALRTISQEVPAAVCHLHNGVAPEMSAKLLREGLDNFDVMADALLNGNPDFGIIGGEQRAKTRRLIEEVKVSWAPLKEAGEQVLANPADESAVEVLYSTASDMLDQTYYLLSELEGEYANPVELLYSDALLLEVAGRQSMLSQRISFLGCLVWSGAADETYIDLLNTAAGQFKFGMAAMQNGAPELGIQPPPTPEIAAKLEYMSSDFDVISGHLVTIMETGALAPDNAETLYEILADKMYTMNDVAHLYAIYSKRVY
ncbi:type IV pili methyl-accepting chemotaxis transducer N-terminal domain-containing protein [Cognatiyoonia sp. IB215182]|uniref:type IV pili methyl-accepting chemotaxis transducer N-terminal domain-containing protein n=1 Tax=Cognatiyoonia sp. IB215182 TaxID=3097353 RepID=UPI002A176DE9|nr:type IV pili methyl-accepting chemotaxis transducer N-terminal domain-containing protein [Cognatiyoonia sp. IB215182]MDX8354699.1 type IV pili methyl-accepting chemotaxis transducer N-terminal domain-containing protein [Cognatiyoonia sp. IB215182]